MAATEPDYRKFYNLEQYLFEEVGPQYRKTATLSVFDFFCIIIWKANRAKSKIAKKLITHAEQYPNLEVAVNALARQIADAVEPRERLKVLFSGWGFRLPMASAILTVLYPEDFTVYDIRVCQEIGDFANLQNRTNFDSLWNGYASFLKAVKTHAPSNFELRDKDRWLWGKSFYKQLSDDISDGFSRLKEDDES